MEVLSEENDVGQCEIYYRDSLGSVYWLIGTVKGPFPSFYFSLSSVCEIKYVLKRCLFKMKPLL